MISINEMTKRHTKKVSERRKPTKAGRGNSQAHGKEKRKQLASSAKCKLCSESFDDALTAVEHQRTCQSIARPSNVFINYDSKVKFMCTVCNQLFQFETGLKKHEQRHRPPGGFVCSVCDERFLTDAERSLHKETIHKIFNCLLCESKLASEESYLAHIAEQHDGRDRDYLVCSDCGAQFRQPNQLRLHNESKCGTVRSYSCRECNSKFISRNTLNAHMLIHSGVKKNLCDFCGKSFLSRGQLQVHERCHTGERPFKCDLCDKAFSHRESLVTHSSVHTGIRPYVCEACDNRFSCIGNLIKHRRARPQTCGLPQYSSNSKCAPRPSSKHAGSLTMKIEPKTKRSYGKRKPISVPELLAVRVEMTSEEGAKSKISQDEVLVKVIAPPERMEMTSEECARSKTSQDEVLLEVILPASHEKVEPIPADNIEYDLNGAQEISVYEEVQEIDWTQHTEHSQAHVKMEETVIGPLETATIFDEHATAYNVIVTEHGSFIISKYDAAATDERTTIHEVTWPIDAQSSGMHHQEEVIVLNTSEIEQHVEYENRISTDDSAAIKCGESNTVSNFTIIDHSYEASGNDEMDLDTIVAEVESKKPPRKMSAKSCQFNCQFCDLKYTSKKRLTNHMGVHGSDGTLIYKCQCCPQYFGSVEEMEQHKIDQHALVLTCNVCQKRFKDTESLHNHVKYVHEKRKKTKTYQMCPKCGKTFASNYALTDHENSDCGRSPNYKCDDCGKFYHSAGSLKSHRLIHTGEMPYGCNTCGKAFRNKGQLKIHSRCHSGEKPYTCDHCDKSFAHRESLLTHTSLHTGRKRFLCQGCNLRFSCISNLQAHRRSHKATCGLLPIITKPINWTTDSVQPKLATDSNITLISNIESSEIQKE